jgi:predicted GNAT superfamily acetyltransferase
MNRLNKNQIRDEIARTIRTDKVAKWILERLLDSDVDKLQIFSAALTNEEKLKAIQTSDPDALLAFDIDGEAQDGLRLVGRIVVWVD